MIKRIHDKNLSKVRGGKGGPPVCDCTCTKICACNSVPGDDAASYAIQTDLALNQASSDRVPGSGHG